MEQATETDVKNENSEPILAQEFDEKSFPTLFEWLGGRDVLRNLMKTFYAKVVVDDLLEPLFTKMKDDHPDHVAMWFEEVLGGAKIYTEVRGGFKSMIARHRGRRIRADQRERWVKLMIDAADEIGMPSDPEFRSAFVGYLEWGSRRAFRNSQPDAPPSKRTTMPKWGWGEAPPGTL
ncbi:group II truncated hemoglobin [Aliikangiella maris]|uniref:Group II truncated hemoglobin n=2 Tax=Aliikangiella maris TaxID=3162458 RepID=A0ABV3MS46_9GAMM